MMTLPYLRPKKPQQPTEPLFHFDSIKITRKSDFFLFKVYTHWMSQFLALDEEGYFKGSQGVRIQDSAVGYVLLEKMNINEFGVLLSELDGQKIFIEAFDKPYVVQMVHWRQNQLFLDMPYGFSIQAQLHQLCVDEWDRFHGLATNGVPFVLTRKAQAELFQLASDFDDDSIQLGDHKIQTPDYYLKPHPVEKADFWTQKYQESPHPSWDLGQAHPEIKSVLQQLKLQKLRILVPGCGAGHDAAYLAAQGHHVTAIDFSEEAITRAKKQYGHIPGLQFIHADIFQLSNEYKGSFDLIFEHTLYCAISPTERDHLIKVWKSYLTERGHLLGIFFVVPKRGGPYFGGSEWELRQKLSSRFHFLYWTRLQHSPQWRIGAELIIYAQLLA